MQLKYNVQYLTNENGTQTVVQLPLIEWKKLIKDYSKLRKLLILKSDLKSSLSEIEEIKKGNHNEVTLLDFLNEN
ncbi:MAG: hypothetical protein NTW25_03595 [Candidatus Kapabacteria bacterium]|nr:hypothetical protein [Candidatus Kapabacteria bacterium]